MLEFRTVEFVSLASELERSRTGDGDRSMSRNFARVAGESGRGSCAGRGKDGTGDMGWELGIDTAAPSNRKPMEKRAS